MCSARLRTVVWMVACVGIVAAMAGRVLAQLDTDTDNAKPRVRSSHPYIRAMIAEASQRSATFRGLVEAIEKTDGIIYVEQGECSHRVTACLTMSIAATPGFRFLRVLVDARQLDWDVMASIGHELRHALEVLSESGIRSTEAIFLYYYREGMTMGETFETSAAIRAGNTVRNEVASFSKRRAF
jgi:hypothetical protein